MFFFFQAEDGIRDLVRSRGLGDVYKRQRHHIAGKALGNFGRVLQAIEAFAANEQTLAGGRHQGVAQRIPTDLIVDQGRNAADLGQGEPDEEVLRPVLHQQRHDLARLQTCLLYTSDAADERSSVDLGGRRIIKKKKNTKHNAGVETTK